MGKEKCQPLATCIRDWEWEGYTKCALWESDAVLVLCQFTTVRQYW